MKSLSAVLFLLLFLSSVNAFNISRHAIEVEVKGDGHASVLEQYFLSFPNEYQKEEFARESKRNGSSLLAWQAFDARFFPHFGSGENDLIKPVVSFEEADDKKFLSISYGLEKPLFNIVEDTPRESKWAIDPKELGVFVKGSTLEIPDSTTITFVLPKNAQLKEKVTPDAEIKGNRLTWNSTISSQLILNYFLSKPITPLIDTSKLIQGILGSRESIVAIGLIALVCVVLYWRREKISGKIEDFVLERSEIESKDAGDEEIEIKV